MRIISIAPLLAALLLSSAGAAAAPALRFPVACEIGRTCLIQNYVDRDPASGRARDFTCGSRTYDDHNGTDIRVPTLAAQRAGVAVLAAAPGRVLRGRDGVADVSVRTLGEAAVQGAECGNGVVIDHGEGWETQYCHMARGSLAVRPGETIAAGQTIGRIGLSGLTEYPHLHFTVRHRTRVVDPFAPAEATAGEVCGRPGATLWEPAVAEALAYRPSEVLNTGFAGGAVTIEAGAGAVGQVPPAGRDAPALVAFVRAVGLKAGDVQRITVTGPDGGVLADQTADPLDRDKAQSMLYAGRRRPPSGWTPGDYAARYEVRRGAETALATRFTLRIER